VATFDGYVKQVAEFVEELRGDGRQIRHFDGAGEPAGLLEDLPVRVGAGAASGIILRGDTFAELGNPAAGSCAFLLWTDDASLLEDGRITLVGPGVQQSPDGSLPFGQVLLVAGKDLGKPEHETLEQSQYVSDKIEGYMIRSTPGRMWSRVSRDAAGKGFDFDTLGKALIALFRSEIPKIEAMEILFLTSDKQDVQKLDRIAEQVREISKEIVREVWLDRGYDILECSQGVDCGSCSDKDTCDDIREVVKIRKKKIKEKTAAASS
jgi:CO dehydrogenase/acetyl-CoA synthase beta subunit